MTVIYSVNLYLYIYIYIYIIIYNNTARNLPLNAEIYIILLLMIAYWAYWVREKYFINQIIIMPEKQSE